ncbi:FCD domain-containing protein [Rhizobium sp. 3T7]|uniref:FCD domain-containing protein n=1 Tax=Rhizobium sp. 3T7 TaxID=2874922 RepID=UPI0021E24CBF|nr:FCD domain-containing protein [Rhizobium sp. 3T7]
MARLTVSRTEAPSLHLHSMLVATSKLEAICGRLSAERMTVEGRRLLKLEQPASAKLMHAGADEEDAAYYIEFHARLHRGAHNDHILELVTQTRARLAWPRAIQLAGAPCPIL